MKTRRLHIISLWTLFALNVFRSLHSRVRNWITDSCWFSLQIFGGDELGWHKTLPLRMFCANTQQAAGTQQTRRNHIRDARWIRPHFQWKFSGRFLSRVIGEKFFRFRNFWHRWECCVKIDCSERQLCEKKLQKFSLCTAGVLVASWAAVWAGDDKKRFQHRRTVDSCNHVFRSFSLFYFQATMACSHNFCCVFSSLRLDPRHTISFMFPI